MKINEDLAKEGEKGRGKFECLFSNRWVGAKKVNPELAPWPGRWPALVSILFWKPPLSKAYFGAFQSPYEGLAEIIPGLCFWSTVYKIYKLLFVLDNKKTSVVAPHDSGSNVKWQNNTLKYPWLAWIREGSSGPASSPFHSLWHVPHTDTHTHRDITLVHTNSYTHIYRYI